MAALLILLSTASHLSESLFIKRYNAKYHRGGFVFTAFVSLFSMLFFVFTDRGGFHAPALMWGYGLIAGVLYCMASFLTYIALQIGSYAMTMLILSYSVILSVGYGIVFLKEEVTVFTVIGILLVLLSLYLVRADKKEGESKKKLSFRWLVCVLASAIGSGMFGVVQRMQQIRFENTCTNEFMIVALGFSAALLTIVGVARNRSDLGYVLKHGLPWTLGAGASNGATNAMIVFLHTLMPISLSSPIRVGVKVIASFALSVFLFREKFQRRQIFGVALGTVAVILLNIK